MNDLFIFFLQLSLLLSVALVSGTIARKLNQPAVLGELAGGVLLGPTFLGSWDPSLFNYIFNTSNPVMIWRETIVKSVLLLFLFVAGMEIRFTSLHTHFRAIVGSSILGMFLPFCLGVFIVYSFPSLWGKEIIKDQKIFALFIGTSLSISALPVISRILMDMGLTATKLGTTIMSSAALADLIGWTLFAIILRSQMSSSTHTGIEIYTVFMSFLAGAVFQFIFKDSNNTQNTLRKFVINFIAPLYFVSIGLKVNFISNFDLPLILLIFSMACIGKIIGATLGALWGKFTLKEALAIGFGLNARGAVEIVLASIAFEYKLIDERIMVALIVMALGTSVLSSPMMKILLRDPK